MNIAIPARIENATEELAESILSCNEISARTQAYLAQQQFEVVQTCMEAGNKQLRILLEAKNPKDLAAQQAQVFSELVSELTVQAQEMLDIHKQARAEMELCLEDVLEVAQTETEAAA